MVNKPLRLNLSKEKKASLRFIIVEQPNFYQGSFPIPKIMLSLILLNILVNKKPDCSNRFQIYFKIEFL
jgi:hypothetical protein